MDRIYKNVTVDKKINFTVDVGVNNEFAFIEITENIENKYYYLTYPKSSYECHSNYIKIENNYFYDDYIDLNINTKDIQLSGFLYYSEFTISKNKHKHFLINRLKNYLNRHNPNHVISYHHYIDGVLKYNDMNIDFEDGIGFIKDEITNNKDFIYLQSNILDKEVLDYKKVAFNLYVEDKNKKGNLSRFKALFILNDKEYHFNNYKGSRLTRIIKKDNVTQYILSNNKYKLIIRLKPTLNNNNSKYHKAIIHITILKNKKIIFKQKMSNSLYEKRLPYNNLINLK